MGVQVISMAVLVLAAVLLSSRVVVPAEGSRALLNLGKLIDHFLDCPPPPVVTEAPAPEPYSVPYGSPPGVEAPAPEAPEYPSPPGPPYADQSPPSPPIAEPVPEYPTPPAGGY